jgi:choice-of-anchor A domain-containing protein
MSGSSLVTGPAITNPGSRLTTSGTARVARGVASGALRLAVSDARAASLAAANLRGTSFPGAINLNAAQTETISSQGVLNVIDVSSIHLSGSSVLTLRGGPNDLFVVNDPGVFNLSGTSRIALAGGLTPDHVLFNFIGSGGGRETIEMSGRTSAAGTLLAPNRDVSLAGITLVGAVITGGSHLDLHSSVQIYQDLFNPVSEPCLAGVNVRLTGADVFGHAVNLATTTTGAGYSFVGLVAGTYTLSEPLPSGYAEGTDNAGTLGGTAGNDLISNIVVHTGQHGFGYDFGERLQ